MTTTTSLEQRIADALKDNATVTAIDLAALVVEVTAAIDTADQSAITERERALDPSISPNLAEARQKMEDSAFAANRLRTLLPRLQQHYLEVDAAEEVARWRQQYDKIESLRNHAASEFTKTKALIEQLSDIFRFVEGVENQVRAINASSPSGQPHLTGAELIARNLSASGFSKSDPSILQTCVLRSWSGKEIWPPHCSSFDVSTVMPMAQHDPLQYTEYWFEAKSAHADAIRKEQMRTMAYHDQQAVQREENENERERTRADALRRSA